MSTVFSNWITYFTSGNIFFEDRKFEMLEIMFGENFINYHLRRAAVDAEVDQKILGYSDNYLKNSNFKEYKNVSIDFALAKQINPKTFATDLLRFLEDNPNINYVGLKSMMVGIEGTKQWRWLMQNLLNDQEKYKVFESLNKRFKCDSEGRFVIANANVSIIVSGQWDGDVVLSGGELMNHNGKSVNLQELINMSLNSEKTKETSPKKREI